MVKNSLVEEWRPTHHPDYDVSNLGRVRSRARGTIQILKPGRSSSGYWSVSFGRNNSQSTHVLVAAAFIGPCPEGQEVRHKDDNRANPISSNLEYGTRKENIADMIKRGRQTYRFKLTPEQQEQVRFWVNDGATCFSVASHFGVSRATINRILNRG
jgi:NUMOD4 motif.